MVRVRILQGATLLHEGRTYQAGHELELSEDEARALEEQGIAERPGAPKGQRRRGGRSRAEAKPEG